MARHGCGGVATPGGQIGAHYADWGERLAAARKATNEPDAMAIAAGAIQGQRASSVVNGRVGEWIELGGSSTSAASSGSGILSSRESAGASDRRIWLKVEEVR